MTSDNLPGNSFPFRTPPIGFKRYRLIIEYRGERFYGWQRQELSPTVQAELEDILPVLIGRKRLEAHNHTLIIYGSGRTDAGVHALGQVAHFDAPAGLDCDKIQYGLNFYLAPKGAAVLDMQVVSDTFHARFSALQRSYKYIILNRRPPSVLMHQDAWHVRVPLNIDWMQSGADQLIGTHDFTSFRATECQAKSPIRTLDSFTVQKQDDCIVCTVSARSFLHNQVRIMVGTLREIGEGKIKPRDIPLILAQKKRSAAGQTAPACGLFFVGVKY